MNKPNFNITENYFKENYEKIKQELQIYVDCTAEYCGENSVEHIEAMETKNKILNGDLEELGFYLSESYYAVTGDIEKYCPADTIFIDLINKLPKISSIRRIK